jgi:NCS1 nucleoside transporter family
MATRDQSVTQSDAEPGVLVREGSYGTQVIAVEPGGAEFIPLNERHGRPLQLFWTWTSPNMEFATIFVGVLAVSVFGLGFWAAALALVLGSAIGGVTQGILSMRGPRYGVPQMVLSRLGFGYWGNALPAGINAVVAGIGWFAVNSVSGALALNVLTHMPQVLCLLIIVALQVVVAFFGYNLVHVFERYAFPVLTIIFLIASGVILSKAHPGVAHHTAPGGFLIMLGASFGYAVGWNPYACDYTRYYSPSASKKAIALWSGLGLFLSCALLEIVGAAAATLTGANGAGSNPTGAFTGLLATPLADFTLLAIALGAVSANVLNIYSGALSFTALGIKLPLSLRRAAVALGFGAIGFFLAWSGLHNAGTKYENFLLIISYWIAPWLAVYFCDQVLRRDPDEALLFDTKHTNWAGPVAMAAGMGLSIWLFSNQTEYIGVVPSHVPSVGDLTFEVGFVITAVIYLGWHALAGRSRTLVTRLRGASDRLGAGASRAQRVAGQEDRERGWLGLDQDDPAAVGGGHGPGQGQAEAGAFWAAADAALEDARRQLGRHAAAFVPHLDHHRTRALRRLQGDGAAAVHQRVVHQRGQHLGQPARRHVGLQAADADHRQPPARPPERGLPLGHLLPDDLVDAGELGRRRGGPPGRAEQLGHHVGEAFGLGEGGVALLAHHVGIVGRGDHLLQAHRQRGQRGAQLVRGVHGQLTVGGQQGAQPTGGGVQAVGELVEFGHPVPAAERTRVPRGQPPGRLGEFLDRTAEPARDHDRKPRGQRRQDQHQPGDDGRHGGAVPGRDHQRRDAEHADRAHRHGVAPDPRPPAHRSARGVSRRGVSRRGLSRRVQSGTPRRGPSRCTAGCARHRPACGAARRCACRASWSRSTTWRPRPRA